MAAPPKRPAAPAPDPNWELELDASARDSAPTPISSGRDEMLSHALLRAAPPPPARAPFESIDDFGDGEARATLPPPEEMSRHVARMMSEAALLEDLEHEEDRPTRETFEPGSSGFEPRIEARDIRQFPADVRQSFSGEVATSGHRAPAAQARSGAQVRPSQTSMPAVLGLPASLAQRAPPAAAASQMQPLARLPSAPAALGPGARANAPPAASPLPSTLAAAARSSASPTSTRRSDTAIPAQPSPASRALHLAREVRPSPARSQSAAAPLDLSDLPAVFALDGLGFDEPSSAAAISPSLERGPSSAAAISTPFAGLELPELAPDPEAEKLLLIEARFTAGDYGRALVLAEGALEEHPSNAAMNRFAESCRDMLYKRYLERLGSANCIPQMMMQRGALTGLAIDHRSGFLLSCVDGMSTIEEIIDVSAMPRLEAVRILYELVQEGVIEMASPR